MATRALPLLLVFITFLFINAEVWMLSSTLDGALLWLTVLLFAAVAVAFLLVRLPEEVDGVDDRIDAPLLVSASRGTPMAEAARDLVQNHSDELDLQRDAEVRGFERGNLIVVLLVIQAAQVLLLALAVFVFFMLFGALTMNETVQEAWIAAGTHHVDGLGNVSVELFQTAVFLAAFSGLYFTVYVVTDESYRVQFFTGVLREMEKAVAVRTVYRHLCRRRDAEATPRTPEARPTDADPSCRTLRRDPRHRLPGTLTPATTEPPAPGGDERLSRRAADGTTSGVEVLLDERRDGVDGRLVVAADLDRVALAGAEGHDEQRRAGVDGVVAGDGEGDLGVEVGGGLRDDRGGAGVQADGGADVDGLAGHRGVSSGWLIRGCAGRCVPGRCRPGTSSSVRPRPWRARRSRTCPRSAS